MTQPAPVHVRLMCFICLSYLFVACGQKQNLQSVKPYPDIQRVVTTPDGFELWFNPSQKDKGLLWIIKDDHESTPIPFQTSSPINIPADDALLHVRYAYQSAQGVGSISPSISLRRQSKPRMPEISCKTSSESIRIRVQWSEAVTDQSERVFVRQKHKILAVLSRAISDVSISPQGEILEIEYENRGFRSARWMVNCP